MLRLSLLLLFIGGSIFAQETKEVVFEKIPEKFSQRTDALGFGWQVNRFGAITSGETQYLPSGLKLLVSAVPFQPQSAALKDGSASNSVVDLDLVEKRKAVSIKRSLWFDLNRGGVRVIDTFTNTGKTPVSLPVELKTTFPFSWQSLRGHDGDVLTGNPAPSFGDRDFGLLVRFSQVDGRHDTLFIVSSEKGALRPALSASSNNRELAFSYELEIKPGESKSLLHWVMQRNLNKPSDVEEEVKPFYQARRLIDSRMPLPLLSSLANFDRDSFPKDGGIPIYLDSMLSLNEFVDHTGIHRRDEDILLVSANNQLVGTLNPKAELTVNSGLDGAQRFLIKEIAAIQGGGGIGRVPRIFLRNGQVIVGSFTSKNLSLKVGNEWSVDSLRPDELNLLLCSLSQEDGTPPAGTGAYLALRDGSVLAVSGKGKSLVSMETPWGGLSLPITEIEELGYVASPSARFRLVTAEGTRLTVFIPTETLSITLASGKVRDIPTSLITRIWKKGRTSITTVAEEDYWLDFSEVPENQQPENGFLLNGNNLLFGSLDGSELAIIDGASVVKIAVAEIVSIQRSLDQVSDSDPLFEIGLKNGDVLSGKFRSSTVTVKEGKRSWSIPVGHLIAYKSKASSK